MKTLAKISLVAAGLAAASLSLLRATTADTSATAAPSAATPAAPDKAQAHAGFAANHPRLRALLARRHAMRQRVASRLGLTADQTAQLKADRAKTATAIKSIRGDTSLTPEQKRAKIRDTFQSTRSEMRGVLTPEQQAKVKHFREGMRRRRHHRS